MDSTNPVGLDGPTLMQGLAEALAPVVPIRPEGRHQGNHRDHDNSLATCECPDALGAIWQAGTPACPRHWPETYSKVGRHLPEVRA